MKITKAHFVGVLATLLTVGGAFMGFSSQTSPRVDEALAATSEQKADFQQMLTSLQAVDTAYASGNSAEPRLTLTKQSRAGTRCRRRSRSESPGSPANVRSPSTAS